MLDPARGFCERDMGLAKIEKYRRYRFHGTFLAMREMVGTVNADFWRGHLPGTLMITGVNQASPPHNDVWIDVAQSNGWPLHIQSEQVGIGEIVTCQSHQTARFGDYRIGDEF